MRPKFLIFFLAFRQTASLFYDRIKINDYDSDVPSLFQTYSHCFLSPKTFPINVTSTNEKYRLIDGSENNQKFKMRGASFTAFGRILKAQYDDNIHSIRKSIRGYNLPSPRNIVRKLFLNDEANLNKFASRKRIPNMAAVIFGQFLAHDVSLRQPAQYIDGGNGKLHTISFTFMRQSERQPQQPRIFFLSINAMKFS